MVAIGQAGESTTDRGGVDPEQGAPIRGADHDRRDIAQQFFDLTGELLAVLDEDGTIIETNAAFVAASAMSAVELDRAGLTDVIVPSDPAIFTIQSSLLGPASPRVDFELGARVGGRDMTLMASLTLVESTGNRLFVARDISEERRLRSQLESRGNKDELAGLSNRQGFSDALDLELKVGESVAVIHVSMDRIDAITTEPGEQVTNQLLQAAVSRMRRNLRDSDVMARFAKSEFAIMLVGGNVQGSAERLGAELAESLRRAFGVKGARVEVISAIGIAVGDSATHTAEQLLGEAATAVGEARRSGFTCAAVFGKADLAAAHSGHANDDLQTKLAQNDEYRVNVQGIFTADGTGSIGVEALLAKHLPAMRRAIDDGDDILPATTLTAAQEVFAALGPWLAAHRSRRICFNVAAHQLDSPDLCVGLAAAANAHLIEPRQVVCELSETAFAHGAISSQHLTEEIRRHGFQLSIDNFGTDTAAFANLRSLDASYVKLDPTLVTNLFTSDFHSALVRSVVDVARTMGISVIANGVENQQQLEAVRNLGCTFVQGSGVHASESLAAFAGRIS